jgi:hypothetical protein
MGSLRLPQPSIRMGRLTSLRKLKRSKQQRIDQVMPLKNRDILAERCRGAIRLRVHYEFFGCPRAISSLFVIGTKNLRVTDIRARWLRPGREIKRSRYRYSDIEYLGLGTFMDSESNTSSWAVVLKLADGRKRYLSYGTTDYWRYDTALADICRETGIRRFDPI